MTTVDHDGYGNPYKGYVIGDTSMYYDFIIKRDSLLQRFTTWTNQLTLETVHLVRNRFDRILDCMLEACNILGRIYETAKDAESAYKEYLKRMNQAEMELRLIQEKVIEELPGVSFD